MPQLTRSSNTNHHIEKSISKGVKKVIAESGIDPSTRRGNKELSYLIKRLAKQPIRDLKAATQVGEDLGQKIVALSRQLGRENLDQGIIRKLVIAGDLPAIAELSASEAQSATSIQTSSEEGKAIVKEQLEPPGNNAFADKDHQPDTVSFTDAEATSVKETEQDKISAKDEEIIEAAQSSAEVEEDEEVTDKVQNSAEVEEDENEEKIESSAENLEVEVDEATVPNAELEAIDQTTALENNDFEQQRDEVETLEGAVTETKANTKSQSEEEVESTEDTVNEELKDTQSSEEETQEKAEKLVNS
ncbi:MAG: hypothetical protein Kow00121_63190 [Elainellaceae cyanobacterium]